MIEVRDMHKRYGATMAANGITLSVKHGMVTGLLGPNGAGKTTTIRVMTGLVAPDRGHIEVDGIDVASRPIEARARLGVVPETVGAYDHLTVGEHVEYSGALHGLAGLTLRARVTEILSQLELTPLADRRAAGLSLGERRRLALARALVHRPTNLLLDEPTNGLDVMSARRVRNDIRRLADEGCAVLVSSHVMPEVAALCDHIIVLARGTVAAEGTAAELQDRARAASLEDAFVELTGSTREEHR